MVAEHFLFVTSMSALAYEWALTTGARACALSRLWIRPMPFDLGYPPVRSLLARPGYDGTSLQEVALRFSTEDACVEHVMQMRFGQGVPCQNCGGISRWRRRATKQYALRCCGALVSPLTGTLFHRTKLPLSLWFYAMLHFANSHEGVNAGFLERHLGISYNAAFRMARRIRWHLSELERMTPIASAGMDVEVKVDSLHRVRSGTSGHNRVNILFAARDGKVGCELLGSSRQRFALQALAKMAPDHGDLRTTCYRTARLFSDYGSRRPRAMYLPCYYIDHPEEVDAIKGFQSYFLWPFQTHHKYASRAHVWLYLNEFLFRYNRRRQSAQTFWEMIGAFPNLTTGRGVPVGPEAAKNN